MIKILSVLLILLGILSAILTIKGYDKTCIGKYIRIKLFIDFVTAFSYIIMGLLLILKVISGRYIIFVIVLFNILDSLINYKIKTQANR